MLNSFCVVCLKFFILCIVVKNTIGFNHTSLNTVGDFPNLFFIKPALLLDLPFESEEENLVHFI